MQHLDSRVYKVATLDLEAKGLHWHQRYAILEKVFAVDDVHNADSIFYGWVKCVMREANTSRAAALSECIVPVAIEVQRSGEHMLSWDGHMRSFNQGDRTQLYMDLKCYDYNCTSCDHTAAHDSEDAVREDAARMGWWKPSTKDWSRARYPKCNWS